MKENKNKTSKSQTGPAVSEVLGGLLSDFYKEKNFSSDFMIVCDASGTILKNHSASCCIIYEKSINHTKIIYHGWNYGTNNFAELQAAVTGLTYLDFVFTSGKYSVDIVSDSEITVKGGNKEYTRGANQSLWNSIEFFENRRFNIKWNHVPRNSNPLSSLCDSIAGDLRKEMLRFDEKVVDKLEKAG